MPLLAASSATSPIRLSLDSIQGRCLLNCAVCAGYVGYVRFIDLSRYVLNVGCIRFVDLVAAVGFVLCFDFPASTWADLFDPRHESSHFLRMIPISLLPSFPVSSQKRYDPIK